MNILSSANLDDSSYALLVEGYVEVTQKVYHTGVVVDKDGNITWSSIDSEGPLTRVVISNRER